MFELAVNRDPTRAGVEQFQPFHEQALARGQDREAVWIQLATVMLNLDETISIE